MYHLKYQDYLEGPRNAALMPNSEEHNLRESYQALRKIMKLETFEDRARIFKTQIFNPIDMNNIPNQSEYINEVLDLKEKLRNIEPEILCSYFKAHRKRLEFRLDLARLDQQIFNYHSNIIPCAIRGSFNHPGLINDNIRKVLRNLVGKIFHITVNEQQIQRVRHVGSGCFANLSNDGPEELNYNLPLNGIITAAHVVTSEENERLEGIYFIPDDFLISTGFPSQLSDFTLVQDANGLITFLQTSENSFKISSYTTKKRVGGGVELFQGNSAKETNPQFLDNEDIIYGRIELHPMQNFSQFFDQTISVSFQCIRNNLPINFMKDENYFSMGYPAQENYALTPFNNHFHFNLLNDRGFSPLVISSGRVHNQGSPNMMPSLSQGKIFHEAPTAEGMSGGPLFKINNNHQQIDIFGIVTAGTESIEEGCY